jgi:hypothetical protein
MSAAPTLLRTLFRRLLSLVAVLSLLLTLVHLVFLDIWMRSGVMILLERRGQIQTGDLVACPGRNMLGTVLAVGGEMWRDRDRDLQSRTAQVALPPGTLLVAVAKAKEHAKAQTLPETECRAVFQQISGF